VAAAAETRMSHIVARVIAAPAVAPESLSCQLRDSRPPVQTEALARSGGIVMGRRRVRVPWIQMGRQACCWA